MNEIEILAMKKEIEKAERELYSYKRTKRNHHEKKTEFAKEVPSLEYVPYKAEPSELAIKLYEFAREFDAYECMDTGYTIEKAEEDLQNPYVLIESLINIARKMMM